MGEADEATRQECPSCGTEQEISLSPGSVPRCTLCGASMLGSAASAGRPPAPVAGVSLPAASVDVHAVDAIDEGDADDQIARLSEQRFDPSKEVARLLAMEKRSTSFLSLVPLWGPVRIWQSEVHGAGEKILWTFLSLVLTVGIGAGIWTVLPRPADPGASLGPRIESDLEALADLVVRFHERYGSYPDPATWESSAERGDSRFYDPWGRVYLFREDAGRLSLGTFGRDGVLGGSGPDADRFVDVER